MRKSILIGLALAGSLAGIAAAQQPGADAPKRGRGEDHRGPGGPGGRGEGRVGPGGILFKDITLTDAQKTQIQDLRKAEHDKMQANKEQRRKEFDELRAARQKGDSAAVKAIMQRNRQAMEQARTAQLASIRNILTVEQRVQFDKNVAELKQREAERAQRVGQRGPRDGRGWQGGKGGKPGRQG
jgi:Spy/CpxP family protein refolding chaperone